ncbi:MarR family winged helix-turn-helix transcriptional regulator [Microbacterium imperiale]|uniref:MarR family transcriptional regulator n=1 Tax=Microbacterium imperiale TaxID=33884 RepID=A0A9W6HJ12_9MICO|nr:MarR family transcriptional regulator [Microbacterium imperiale]MBP2421747.1 DNA-binding MarR family transcriptional regulator [Microbacterium imperiale]BFE42090.1 MarR family transcriptional regulator [Microbacterium imperiale]GLJ81041.1 MarR family transcriptional regulator [Microbacterium imperiale]
MEPTQHMVCFSLYAASRATTKAYAALLEPHGLTYPQYLVLVLLWSRDGRSVRDLGDALDLDSGTLSPLLRRMDRDGLVERTRTADDERVVTVSLTDRGRQLRADLAHVPTCIASGMGVTLDGARELIAALTDLADGMRDTAADARTAPAARSTPEKKKEHA